MSDPYTPTETPDEDLPAPEEVVTEPIEDGAEQDDVDPDPDVELEDEDE